MTLFLFDPHRKGLGEIRKFEVFHYDSAFKVEARFEPIPPENIKIPSTRGDPKAWKKFGRLTFRIGEQEEVIHVMEEDNTTKVLFLMFKDASNGPSTYGGGRYLEAKIEKPLSKLKAGDLVELDFNFSFNPMCARSAAFMCAVPQDRLSSSISAGEKKVH